MLFIILPNLYTAVTFESSAVVCWLVKCTLALVALEALKCVGCSLKVESERKLKFLYTSEFVNLILRFSLVGFSLPTSLKKLRLVSVANQLC